MCGGYDVDIGFGVNLHVGKRNYYPCDEISVKNYHFGSVRAPSGKTFQCVMYIDRLISVSKLNTFCKHNIVHLCMRNHQHTVGYRYNYGNTMFNFKNKVLIIATFNFYWYCYFYCYSYGNVHKSTSSSPLRNHYHYKYNHHYHHRNTIIIEGCCYQLIVTYVTEPSQHCFR